MLKWKSLGVLGCALLASGCSSLGAVFDRSSDNSLEEVDGLLGSVERAHLECQLSRTESAVALDSLHAVVAPDFRGDAIAAYGELRAQLELSLTQAERLRSTIEPMQRAAEEVAAEWSADLDAFGSALMRQKSRERLDETTAAFVAVQAPLVAACDAYDVFNVGLGDHVLYLGHDLNSSSISAIEEELVVLTELQVDLDAKLAACMEAAGDYVRQNALRGQLEAPVPTASQAEGLEVAKVN